MEIGKVYRVNDYALSTYWFHAETNKDLVQRHGFLWKCLGREEDDSESSKYFTCVSLATGVDQPWCEDEMEKVT